MSPWIRLALQEFWLPFHYRKPGCPGGRDFVWLTTFLALLLTLILLLLASREGLLNRFVDVLLGRIPGYGVPISVTNNLLSKGGVNAIDTDVLTEIQALEHDIPGLQVYPYRTLEADFRPLFRLPDPAIWNNTRDDGSTFGPDFDGWAVYPNDPLWTANIPAAAQQLPLTIILNRPLFQTYFDYDRYRQTLQDHLPAAVFADLPARLNPYSEKSLDTLWLLVTIGFRKELVPFEVAWVTRFPVIDKLAFMFPLTTYHALKAAHDFPELRYFPEAHGEGGTRVQQILLETRSESVEGQHAAIEQLAADLDAEAQPYRADVLLTFRQPWPEFWLEAYAEHYHLPYQVMKTLPGDRIAHEEQTLRVPCGRLPSDYLRDAHFTSCRDDAQQPLTLDVTAKGNGFHHALVYVPQRTLLSKAARELETIKDQALAIHPSYQDALNRFGFLSKMLDALQKPYGVFLVIFLFAFLGVQLLTLIGHHRHRYGMLLAKGVEWWQIYAMLGLQIGLALGIGLVVAFGLITAAGLFLQAAVKAVAVQYADTLSIADLNLLPLTLLKFAAVSAGLLAITLTLAAVLLYCLPLRSRTHPAKLL
jgi:hypothetical protein